jgi:hypothetical protein
MPNGSCLCGDVAYEISGPFLEAHHCHCGYCRKAHGTAYASYGMAPAAGLRWLRGESGIARYESSPGFQRCFCGRCGSVVPGPGAAGLAFVPLGNLDGDPGVRPSMHIFTASKAPWWDILDGLPQHAAFPPGFDAPVQPTRPPQDPPGRPRGSCLCGRVAFVVEAGKWLRARCCYCSRCRKAQATGHATNGGLPDDALRFTRGEAEIASYKIPEARFFRQDFCRRCGAKLPRIDRSRKLAVVPLGSFDDLPGIRPQCHIFAKDRAPWIGIHDALPQHAEYPPEG